MGDVQRLQPQDYDMAGYTAKYGPPDQSDGKHLTDEFKLPNHMTFSTDSKYSTPGQPGGTWSKGPRGEWHFAPSEYNLQQHSAGDMQSYFNMVEPDAVLDLPAPRGR